MHTQQSNPYSHDQLWTPCHYYSIGLRRVLGFLEEPANVLGTNVAFVNADAFFGLWQKRDVGVNLTLTLSSDPPKLIRRDRVFPDRD